MTKNGLTVLEEITEIILWFRDLESDFAGLNELLFQRQRLAGFSFALSVEIAEARKSWGKSQSDLEYKKNKKRVEFGKEDVSLQKADYLARVNTAKEFEAEKQDEAIFYGNKQIYDSVTHVLDAMMQKIAHLRQEWHLKQFQNG